MTRNGSTTPFPNEFIDAAELQQPHLARQLRVESRRRPIMRHVRRARAACGAAAREEPLEQQRRDARAEREQRLRSNQSAVRDDREREASHRAPGGAAELEPEPVQCEVAAEQARLRRGRRSSAFWTVPWKHSPKPKTVSASANTAVAAEPVNHQPPANTIEPRPRPDRSLDGIGGHAPSPLEPLRDRQLRDDDHERVREEAEPDPALVHVRGVLREGGEDVAEQREADARRATRSGRCRRRTSCGGAPAA